MYLCMYVCIYASCIYVLMFKKIILNIPKHVCT